MTASNGLLRVFDVQRFCLHDGPGIRTVVFLKGCSLRCRWCQNPESLRPQPEMAWYPERCLGCLRCVAACTHGAMEAGDSLSRINRSSCQACGDCAEVCPTEALRLIGGEESPQHLLQWVERDRPYYESSAGGVTLSGGEPLLQAGPAGEWLRLCREAGLHTTVETCGAVPWEAFVQVLPGVDLFYFDLKAWGDELHQQWTGSPQNRILENARLLSESGANVVFRLPVVPGCNDSTAVLEGIARFLQEIDQPRLRLLQYHAGGEGKIRRIAGKQPLLKISSAQATKALQQATTLLEKKGLDITWEGLPFPGEEAANKEQHPDGESPLVEASPSGGKRPFSLLPDGEGALRRTLRGGFPHRVWRLREAVQEAKPAICLERALLVTDYFRQQQKRPLQAMIVQKAEALCHIMSQRQARIYDDELLVGCFSSKRVGGSIFPELHGVAMLEDLLLFSRRSLNPLQLEPNAARQLLTRVMPFWLGRFLSWRAFPPWRALPFLIEQLQGKKYLINETGGISHFVPDYGLLLRYGTEGIARQAREAAAKINNKDSLDGTKEKERREGNQGEKHPEGNQGEDRRDFYRAVQIACRALEELARPYAMEARQQAASAQDPRRRETLERIARVCERVPRYPARTLHEAFQSLLFAQIALNQESLDNSVSPGRLDQLLFPYYQADREAGRLSEEEARELVGCFTVKMSEIVPVFSRRITRFHGGMFNGQVVVVGGTTAEGQDATNDLTWIFLDAMDALRMRQPNYHARLHQESPRPYLQRIAAMLRDGSGAPSLLNDEEVVPLLQRRGASLEDARDYSPVGCIEPVVCGKSFGSTDAALVHLPLCLERALELQKGGPRQPPLEKCRSFEGFLARFRAQVEYLLAELIADLQAIEEANRRYHPTPLTSMLLAGCLDSGLDSTAGGALYNSSGVQGVGVADVADSLAAIEEVLFRRQRCDWPTLQQALRQDFAGYSALRGDLLRAPKYGNDHPRADHFAAEVMALFAQTLGRYENTRGGPYLAGFYSVTAHQAFGQMTGALPSGRQAKTPLANGLSCSDGFDRLGPTAFLNSASSMDLSRLAQNGANVNLKLDPLPLQDTNGLHHLTGLLQGYFARGGMQLQINILDPTLLLEARDHPERHPHLLVRVSGYSAYFNDLSPQMKQEIIQRSLHRSP